MEPVESASRTESSRARQLATRVYDAHGSGRILWLDGPWWLAAVALAALSVLNFAPGHWKWLAIPVIAAVAWVPRTLHWVLGLGRSVGAFRDGYRGK